MFSILLNLMLQQTIKKASFFRPKIQRLFLTHSDRYIARLSFISFPYLSVLHFDSILMLSSQSCQNLLRTFCGHKLSYHRQSQIYTHICMYINPFWPSTSAINAVGLCHMRMLCWWPEQSPNCLQLPVLCSHSKVSPSLTCLSRFPALSVHLPSPPPSSLLSYLPLKAAEIFFCVCKNFAFCCFHCFLSIFFFCAYLPELSVLLYPTPPFPTPLSIHSTACHVSFMFVCLFVIRYAPYEIWRIWYTEYVKLKFPTMLLLFLTAPRHVPIYVPRSVSQPQLLLHLPYLSPYFVCFV